MTQIFFPLKTKMNCRPVSAKDIARRSFEQAYHIEDVLVKSLIEAANTGIHEQVMHGHLHYAFSVPPFIYGYPCYDAHYIVDRMRQAYAQQGFDVTGEHLSIRLAWDRDEPSLAAASPASPAIAAAAAFPRPMLPPSTTILSVPVPVPPLPTPAPPRPTPAPPRPPTAPPQPTLRTIVLQPLSSTTSRAKS